MPYKNSNGLDACYILSRVDALAHQLQDVLSKLRENADQLTGDLFHHDALFRHTDCSRLDAKLAEIISELNTLASLNADE